MKVLYIVTAYARHSGDVITPWLAETIRRLGSRGIEVEVLAPAYRGMASQRVDGVKVHRFRYAPRQWETLTHDQTAPDRIRERPVYLGLVPSYTAAGALSAARLARSGRFDLVHAFWPLPHGLFGIAAKRAAGIPLVCTFFGVELTWMESQLPFLRPVLRAIVHASDAVTVISSYTASKLERAVAGASPVIIPFGATVEPSTDLSPPFSQPDDVPMRLLFVGRLVERKGVHLLLDAVARLSEEDSASVHLTVVGDGSERTRLEGQASRLGIADRVHFTGYVTAERLRAAFEDADVFVLPAVEDRKGDVEGLGVVLIEALAHGRPVIGSSVGGIADIIRHEETGLLVPPGDVAALAAALLRMSRHRAAARAMGEAGRLDVARRFGWNRVTDDLKGVYRSVTRTSRYPSLVGAANSADRDRQT